MDTNSQGMRNFENNQPEMIMDTSDDLIQYENFLSDDYVAPTTTQNNNQAALTEETTSTEIDYENTGTANQNAAAGAENQSGTGAAAAPENKGIDFEDDKVNTSEEFKAEVAIQQLEALGFKVEKDGESDPLKIKEHEIRQIDTVIGNMQNALKADDLSLCREKVIDDVIKKYTSQGKQHLINSEEFKLEVEAGMEEFQYNDRLISLQASQVRTEIQNFINDRTALKNKISAEVKEARDKEITENRKALQAEFNKYQGQVLFGQRLEVEDLKGAYNTLVSGDFAAKIEKDKALQAEFALFLQLKPKLAQGGGGTYGEGVAATVNALNGGAQTATESSLAKTVSRPGAGGVLTDRLSRWKQIGEVKKTENK